MPGWPEIIVILVIILVIFGAGKIPSVLGDLAKGIKNFKVGMKEETDSASVATTPGSNGPTAEAEANSDSTANK